MTQLPAMLVRRLGPPRMMELMLRVVATVLIVDAVLCLLPWPSGGRQLQGFLLNVSFMPLLIAGDGADFVCTVFLVGLVGPSERGTLAGLTAFGGFHRDFPLPIHLMVLPLYGLGGLTVVFCLTSAACWSTVLLFRRSDLMHARLKDA
eukprot:UN4435